MQLFFFLIENGKEWGIKEMKPHSPYIMNVPNLPKRTENRVYWAGDQLEDVEAVTRSYSVKKLFLKISQNSQQNACAGVCF